MKSTNEPTGMFGKKLLECKVTIWRSMVKLLCLLSTCVFAALWAAGAFHITGIGDNRLFELVRIIDIYALPVLLLVTFILFYYWQYSVIVYEHGVMLKRGFKTLTLGFSDIEGILVIKSVGVSLPAVPRDLICPIPLGRMFSVTLVRKSDSKRIIVRAPRFGKFSKAISMAFTEHITQGISPGNMDKANISFGKKLRLENGSFIFAHGKSGDSVTIPFPDANYAELAPHAGNDLLRIMVVDIEKGVKNNSISIPLKDAVEMLNLDALFRILEDVTKRR